MKYEDIEKEDFTVEAHEGTCVYEPNIKYNKKTSIKKITNGLFYVCSFALICLNVVFFYDLISPDYTSSIIQGIQTMFS